jgi:hypothetical protein
MSSIRIPVGETTQKFSQGYTDALFYNENKLLETITSPDFLIRIFGCEFSDAQKKDMGNSLADLIQYIILNNKLGTITELTSNYGYNTNTISRGSKLRHTDSKNGFFPLKKNSIVGKPGTHFSKNEYIYMGLGDGSDKAFKFYMRLGKYRYSPIPEARNIIDTYGLVTCRQIKDVNELNLNVFLNLSDEKTSKQYEKGKPCGRIDIVLIDKLVKLMVLPMAKLYCSEGLNTLDDDVVSDSLLSAMEDTNHIYYNYTLIKIPPIGFEDDLLYLDAIDVNISEIFTCYGYKSGLRKSIYSCDRYFVQMLSPIMNCVNSLLELNKEMSPGINMVREIWNSIPGAAVYNSGIKIIGYFAPELETPRRPSFHREIVLDSSIFKPEIRKLHFHPQTEDCKRKFYILDMIQSESVDHNSNRFRSEWIKEISETDAKLVIESLSYDPPSNNLYPIEPRWRHNPFEFTSLDQTATNYNGLELFNTLVDYHIPPKQANNDACILTSAKYMTPDEAKEKCEWDAPLTGERDAPLTGGGTTADRDSEPVPEELYELYELNLDHERDKNMRETFEENTDFATQEDLNLMKQQYIHILKILSKRSVSKPDMIIPTMATQGLLTQGLPTQALVSATAGGGVKKRKNNRKKERQLRTNRKEKKQRKTRKQRKEKKQRKTRKQRKEKKQRKTRKQRKTKRKQN